MPKMPAALKDQLRRGGWLHLLSEAASGNEERLRDDTIRGIVQLSEHPFARLVPEFISQDGNIQMVFLGGYQDSLYNSSLMMKFISLRLIEQRKNEKLFLRIFHLRKQVGEDEKVQDIFYEFGLPGYLAFTCCLAYDGQKAKNRLNKVFRFLVAEFNITTDHIELQPGGGTMSEKKIFQQLRKK